jgi:hypothetical protein
VFASSLTGHESRSGGNRTLSERGYGPRLPPWVAAIGAGAVLHRPGRAYETRLGARSTLPAARLLGVEPSQQGSKPCGRVRRHKRRGARTSASASASSLGVESNRRQAPYRGALPPWRFGQSGVAESRTRTPSVRATKVTFHTTPHQRPDSNRAPSFWRRRCAQRSLAFAPRRGIEPLSLGRQPSCDPSRITRHGKPLRRESNADRAP